MDRLLDGDSEALDNEMDSAIADVYREEGASELMIQMQEELRHSKSTDERIRIKIKYQKLMSDEESNRE